MSYVANYFREEEYSDLEMSEYEKGFETIYAHNDVVYENDDGVGKILSFSTTNNPERGIDEEELIAYGENHEMIRLEWCEYSNKDPEVIQEGGQRDSRGGACVDLPIRLYHDTLGVVIQFEPITRTFIIPDIYHMINEYTEEVLSVMRSIEMRWSSSRDTLPQETREKQTILMDGDMYEMEKVKENITKLDTNRERYEEQVDELREEIQTIRARNNISISTRRMHKLADREISMYPKGDDAVYFSKHFKIDVDRVMSSRGSEVQPVKIAEMDIRRIEGNLYLKARIEGDIDGFYPINVIGVYLDVPHPHRSGDNSEMIENLCTGEIEVGRLDSLNEMEEKFEQIINSLKTIYLSSIMSDTARIKDDFDSSDYERMHFLAVPDAYGRRDSERIMEQHGLTEMQIRGE